MAALPPYFPSPIMIRHGAILAGGGMEGPEMDGRRVGDLEGGRLNDAPIDFAGRVSQSGCKAICGRKYRHGSLLSWATHARAGEIQWKIRRQARRGGYA